MAENKGRMPIYRIRDLVRCRQNGTAVTGQSYFDVIPMDVVDGQRSFYALMFLCHYSGLVGEREFSFRKCYARGCPQNGCPRVSVALRTANDHYRMDCLRLEQAGIFLHRRGLTLEKIAAKMERPENEPLHVELLDNVRRLAASEGKLYVEPSLDFVRAVEHHDTYAVATVFLVATLKIGRGNRSCRRERCLACYCLNKEGQEKQEKIFIANERLKSLYREFKEAAIDFEEKYFSP